MTIKAINSRNQFAGRIREVVLGDVLCEVEIDTPLGTVSSLVTTRSINELGLQVGSEVVASFKATKVFLAVI